MDTLVQRLRSLERHLWPASGDHEENPVRASPAHSLEANALGVLHRLAWQKGELESKSAAPVLVAMTLPAVASVREHNLDQVFLH